MHLLSGLFREGSEGGGGTQFWEPQPRASTGERQGRKPAQAPTGLAQQQGEWADCPGLSLKDVSTEFGVPAEGVSAGSQLTAPLTSGASGIESKNSSRDWTRLHREDSTVPHTPSRAGLGPPLQRHPGPDVGSHGTSCFYRKVRFDTIKTW